MGVSLHNSGSRSIGRSRRKNRPMSDINVTPMVDVMLVLLIVFMVTAPLLTVGVPVDLPKIQAKSIETKTEPIVITVNRSGQLFLKDHETNMDTLLSQVKTVLEGKPETRVYVRGDKDISYGAIMAVMSKLNMGGITKVALVAELPQAEKPKKSTSVDPQ
ncbi:MAG: protein TolR [Alphaproteobacteria bacterium]|nr:protein TolR [Alphaproteobacteria bacterium]OJV47556.1 MAG: protein TolR [Alphaproteobacteria bacterium 43-37]